MNDPMYWINEVQKLENENDDLREELKRVFDSSPLDGCAFLWISGMGYVVYEHKFDLKKCTLEEGAKAHKVAVFVCEVHAREYCELKTHNATKQARVFP